MSKALVVLSGGQDSTTCLFWAKHLFDEIHAVTFDYAQRHNRELNAARTIAKMAGVASHEVIEMGPILKGTSPLVSDSVLEQYEDGDLPGGIEKTFVPLRNQLFLTIAANRAYVNDCSVIITGVCQADYGGYPDCRQEFITSLTTAMNLGTFTGEEGTQPSVEIRTPLMDMTKAQSIELALSLEECYLALAFSHTAYDGQYPPLGHDHATELRRQGFEEAAVPDPLIIRAWVEQKMELPESSNYDFVRQIPLVDARAEAVERNVTVLKAVCDAVVKRYANDKPA